MCVLCCRGLEILQQIQLSSTRQSPFIDTALERLLDSNLSAKYALTGHLCESFFLCVFLSLFYAFMFLLFCVVYLYVGIMCFTCVSISVCAVLGVYVGILWFYVVLHVSRFPSVFLVWASLQLR